MNAVGIFFNVGVSPANSLRIDTSAGGGGNGTTYDMIILGDGQRDSFYFVGLIADTTFISANVHGTGTASTGFTVDNLTYGSAPITTPEPASFALLGVALGALLVRQRFDRIKP